MLVGEITDISETISSILDGHLGDIDTAQVISTKILKELDRQKILYYSEKGRVNLLNIHGRVLIAILEDPGITQRALSQYLQVSESNIQKSLRALHEDGLIIKTKTGKRNTYKFNIDKGRHHPDIERFFTEIKNQLEPF